MSLILSEVLILFLPDVSIQWLFRSLIRKCSYRRLPNFGNEQKDATEGNAFTGRYFLSGLQRRQENIHYVSENI